MLIGQDIIVLGAGIGGLAVATALAQRGAQVRVFERSPEITEVGAGIQVSPNGGRVLEALGIGPVGDASDAVHLRDGIREGQLLRMPLGAGFQLVHRADLIEALRKAAIAAGVQIELGAEVAAIEGDTLVLAGGRRATAPLIVGADGTRAVSRAAVLGSSDPFFTGQVAWRALILGQGEAAEARVFVGPGRHLVTYPLRGGTLTNIVAVEERDGWMAEGWSQPDDPQNLRAAFAGFVPDVEEMLALVETVNVWGLFRHPIAPQWSKGNLVLLGDAAHPTLPFLAQGAVMALEDAWVLADQLAQHPQAEALARYQALRLPRVTRAIAAANANATNYHLRGIKRYGAHKALRMMNMVAPGRMLSRFAWLYDHDVTA